MVPSKPPPRLIDETEQLHFFPDLTVDDYIAQIIDVDDVVGEDIPAVTVTIEDKSVPIVLSAAENCAASMLRLISRMEAREMGNFWYSCQLSFPLAISLMRITLTFVGCRIGFATVSNFMLLLLVQAPTKEHALRAKRLVYTWQQALRSQGRGWDMMDLGLIRLNGALGLGLANTYYLPLHIREVLESLT